MSNQIIQNPEVVTATKTQEQVVEEFIHIAEQHMLENLDNIEVDEWQVAGTIPAKVLNKRTYYKRTGGEYLKNVNGTEYQWWTYSVDGVPIDLPVYRAAIDNAISPIAEEGDPAMVSITYRLYINDETGEVDVDMRAHGTPWLSTRLSEVVEKKKALLNNALKEIAKRLGEGKEGAL